MAHRTVMISCTTAVGFVFRSVSTSARLCSPKISLCPLRKAARRVAASGVERIRYSSMYGYPVSK